MNPPISAAATRPRIESGTMRESNVDPLVHWMLPPALATASASAAQPIAGLKANPQ